MAAREQGAARLVRPAAASRLEQERRRHPGLLFPRSRRPFLEILAFPPDKGNPKWHRPSDKLFLGIDHTAIVISDTEASLRFYRDVLGMQVAGESENYGPEQEHLNNVFGARLHITALRAASGPGVEFLEYLAPRDGRPYPPEEKANDLIHWQTRFLGISADEAAQSLRKARSAFVSTGVVAAAGREGGIPEIGHRSRSGDTLDAFKIKSGNKEKREVAVPSYIQNISKVQVYCAWAEVILGEANFSSPVK